jgi:peptidoglycan hydrolase CwlO-like protein
MLDATEIAEVSKFLDDFTKMVRALQPDNYEQILRFCEDFEVELIDLLNQVEDLAESKNALEDDLHESHRQKQDLEHRISDLENEISGLNSTICCLEQSKGRSRY